MPSRHIILLIYPSDPHPGTIHLILHPSHVFFSLSLSHSRVLVYSILIFIPARILHTPLSRNIGKQAAGSGAGAPHMRAAAAPLLYPPTPSVTLTHSFSLSSVHARARSMLEIAQAGGPDSLESSSLHRAVAALRSGARVIQKERESKNKGGGGANKPCRRRRRQREVVVHLALHLGQDKKKRKDSQRDERERERELVEAMTRKKCPEDHCGWWPDTREYNPHRIISDTVCIDVVL